MNLIETFVRNGKLHYDIPNDPKPIEFIPLEQCMCGCGGKAPLSKITDIWKCVVVNKPMRFIQFHDSNRYLDEKNRKKCLICGEIKSYYFFPMFSESVERPCKQCQLEFRKIELQIDKILDGITHECECGCGWLTERATKTDVVKGEIEGEPRKYLWNHGSDRKIQPETPTIEVDRGYETPCVERIYSSKWEPEKAKSGFFPKGKVLIEVGSDYRDGILPRSGGQYRFYVPSHEYAWEKEFRFLKRGESLQHLCGNIMCENIYHLKLRSPYLLKEQTYEFYSEEEIPYGFCKCGCGQKTEIYRKTSRDKTKIEGMHAKYVNGHNSNVKKHGVMNRMRLSETPPETMMALGTSPTFICGLCMEEKGNREYDAQFDLCKRCAATTRMKQLEMSGGNLDRSTMNKTINQKKEKTSQTPVLGPFGRSLIPPDGKCLCGCGQTTAIASVSMPEHGIIVGEHYPYIRGHKTKKNLQSAMFRTTDKDTKMCTVCKKPKPVISFNIKADGLPSHVCIECARQSGLV